jgi:serine/threonine-protein kinase PknK
MRKARNRGKPQEFDPQQPPEVPGVTGLTLIGRGGSASVYKGQETALRRTAAVKILHTQLRDADEQQAFKLECEHAGEVGEHPYAADVYRNGFADGWPFLVMRYYARGSLASTLRFAGQQQVGETLTICANVATALQYAHNLGILHRDVKPENILCDAYGDPVLADFGIATDRDAATRTLRHAMTPAYAAPEVLQHGGGWPHSDVWSLAATLYALLAGHPPFYDPRRGDPQANLRALTGPLPAIGRPDVPRDVLETLSRALIGRPDTRTASARRFAEELNADLELLGLPPVQIRVDGQVAGMPLVHPGPVPPPAAGPAPANLTDGRAGPYTTNAGFTTTTARAGFAAGHAAYPPQPAPQPPLPPQGAQWPQAYESTGTMTGLPTGYVSTNHAYRQPDRPAHRAEGKRTKRMPKAAIAGGGALILVILAVAYLLAAPKRPAASTAATTPAASATPTASSAAAGNTAATVAPPQDVTAVVVSDTSVRLSWANAGPHAHDSQVIVSMGSGYNPRPLPNKSPQVITGLSAAQPYCFAVGYYIGSGPVNVAYSKITTKACIRGGKPAAG